MSLFKSLRRRLNASSRSRDSTLSFEGAELIAPSRSRDLTQSFGGAQPLNAASQSRASTQSFESAQPLNTSSQSRDLTQPFDGAQPFKASSQSRDSTPPFEGVQAPFAQAGSPPQSAPALLQENDEDSERIRKQCDRFRTLIIGRANAGKTSILQKVCGTTKEPMVFNARGEQVSNLIAVTMKHSY